MQPSDPTGPAGWPTPSPTRWWVVPAGRAAPGSRPRGRAGFRNDLLQFAGVTRIGSSPREARGSFEYPFGANMCFRRAALEEAGGFREELGRSGRSLLSGEDSAAVDRIREHGWIVWLQPDAVVDHTVAPERCAGGYYWRRLWWQGISRARQDRSPGVTVRLLVAAPVRLVLWPATRDRVHLYRTAETAGYLARARRSEEPMTVRPEALTAERGISLPVRAAGIAAGISVAALLVALRLRAMHPGLLYPDGYQYLVMARGIGEHLRPVATLGPGGDVLAPSADAAAKPLVPRPRRARRVTGPFPDRRRPGGERDRRRRGRAARRPRRAQARRLPRGRRARGRALPRQPDPRLLARLSRARGARLKHSRWRRRSRFSGTVRSPAAFSPGWP